MKFEQFKQFCHDHGVTPRDEVLEGIYKEVQKLLKDGGIQNPGQQIIAFYCEQYKERGLGSRPVIEPKDATRLKGIVKSQGVERMKQLLTTYFGMQDSFFVQRNWDLFTFLNNLSRVATQMEKGRTVSRTEANQLDRRQANVQAIRDYRTMRSKHDDGSEG
jgi:hypothetical protein